MDDNSRKREKKAVEARRMLSERTTALQECLVHILNIRQVWSCDPSLVAIRPCLVLQNGLPLGFRGGTLRAYGVPALPISGM